MDTKARNARYLCLEVSFFGVLSGIVGTFLSIYALRLGATSEDIGLLSSLPALVTLIFLIPAGQMLERYTNILRPVLTVGFVQRAQYVLVAVIFVLPAALRVPALLTIVTLGAMAAAVGTVAFTVMFSMIVPEADRAHVVSTRNLLAGLTSAMAAIAGGWLLELVAFPWNYSLLFLIGFGFSMISLFFVGRLVVPAVSHPDGTPDSLNLRQTLSAVRHTRPFVHFVVANFIANWGIYLPIPLYSLYYVRVLNMGETWIGIITTVSALVPMLTYPLWARAANRFGNRIVMSIGYAGLALFPLTTALAPRQEFLLIPAVMGGIFAPATNLAVFNGLFEVIPNTQRPTYISVHTAIMNLAAFLAPLVSTAILVPLLGIVGALLVGAAMRFIGGIVVYLMVRPPLALSSLPQ